jgi:elongation factor G
LRYRFKKQRNPINFGRVIDYLPSPLDIGSVKGTDPKTGAEIERKFNDDEPFASLVFKVATDPFCRTINFL